MTDNKNIITVKNAEGDPDTTAEIVIQNTIDFEPKVSVIIPVYNVEEYLRECLDSVVNQTLKEIEIICVDDGSTDSSLEILKEYAQKDNRITVMKQENLHAGVARNAGLAVAKGEYLSFLDSDDFFELNMLEDMSKKADEDESDVVICGFNFYDNSEKQFKESSQYQKKYLDASPFYPEYFKNELYFIAPPNAWTKLFKTNHIKKYLVFFENCKSCNDITFVNTSISLAKKISLINNIFIHYRINSGINISTNRESKALSIIHAMKKLEDNLKKNNKHHFFRNVFEKQLLVRSKSEIIKAQTKKKREFLKTFQNTFSNDLYNELKKSLQPKVSVIIPVYNVEEYLRECLDSVVNQTLKEIEIICVNDNSPDNSLAILEEYAKQDGRIVIISNKQNLGSGAARNNGLTIATGNYVGFIDSDDYIDKNYFEELLKSAIENDSDISATTECILFNETGNISKKYLGLEKGVISDLKGKEKIIITTGVSCNKIYKREFINKNNIKCLEIRNPAEDNYFTDISAILANKISVIDSVSYHYRINEKSQTQTLKTEKDFTITDVYLAIDKFINNLDISENEKKQYLSIIDKRKMADFNTFINTMDSKYHYNFKKHFIRAFPNLKNEIKSIIISLTSYPARINTVHQTIESLLNQSKKADKVILWLAPEQFPNKEKDLPQQLLDLCEKGLTIDWYHDIKSYKKLIPTLKKYPEDIIITADDDVIYHKDTVKKLYNAYLENPKSIQCHRAYKINIINKKISNYKYWKLYPQNSKSYCFYSTFFTGVGGVLYPPNCFYKDILNESKFTSYCPQGDDIWFWAMTLLNNTKINLVKNSFGHPKLIEGTQETALWKTNVSLNQNDTQLQNVLKEYPEIMKKLLQERRENFYKNFTHLYIKPYLLFPVYLIKTARMKKKIHKKVCRIIRGQLCRQFENTLLLTKPQIRDFALKNSPTPDYVKKNIKKITNDIYDKFHFRKKHRILGIKFYTKNKHKELSSLLTYSIKQNDLLKQENSVFKNQITELSTSNKHLYRLFNNLIEKYTLSKQGLNTFEYRTFGDLAQTIRKNLYKFPNDIDLIVGVPRSGIIPAYMIALFMNKKCCSLDEFLSGTTSSNGFRNIETQEIKKVLILDDSLCTGREMSRVKEKVAHLQNKYEILFGTIYIKPDALAKTDIWLERVNTPRIWQWNYLNHGISKKSCFDIDGVLCVDPTHDQNDDGEKYIEFIKTAKPLYIPTYEIHSIVTSRLEKYRTETEEWLKKHNVKYKNLIMLDLPSADERRRLNCHAKFKAEQYQKLQDTVLFVESEETQAKEIALLTGKQVICTANDEMY